MLIVFFVWCEDGKKYINILIFIQFLRFKRKALKITLSNENALTFELSAPMCCINITRFVFVEPSEMEEIGDGVNVMFILTSVIYIYVRFNYAHTHPTYRLFRSTPFQSDQAAIRAFIPFTVCSAVSTIQSIHSIPNIMLPYSMHS